VPAGITVIDATNRHSSHIAASASARSGRPSSRVRWWLSPPVKRADFWKHRNARAAEAWLPAVVFSWFRRGGVRIPRASVAVYVSSSRHSIWCQKWSATEKCCLCRPFLIGNGNCPSAPILEQRNRYVRLEKARFLIYASTPHRYTVSYDTISESCVWQRR
jgi:hypothetical protein